MQYNKFYISVFLFIIILFAKPSESLSAKGWEVDWNVSSLLSASSSSRLPFWAYTGNYGLTPQSSSLLLTAGCDLGYEASNGLYFRTGCNLAGSVDVQRSILGMVDRLYISGGWKMLHLDVGMLPRKKELSELSITGGDIIYTGNARNLPGINLNTDWIWIGRGRWFGFKFNWAEYKMIDNRVCKGTMVHNKSLMLIIPLGKKVDISGGLEHWAQWGGTNPSQGEQPASFKDWMRIFFGRSGGSDATISDKINVLGNHLGRECLRVDWRARPFTMTFQYDKPFDDGSGMRWQNIPDGVWTLQFALKDREAFVTDCLFEFIHTTWQSGPAHDRPATEEEKANQDPSDPFYGKVVLGGCDNYFNNGTYASGWTNYGRVIGLPLFIPAEPDENGVVRGIVCNRVRAYHIGVQGMLAHKLPYMFKSTFSKNLGRYNQGSTSPYASEPWNLSLALELDFGQSITNLPLSFRVGAYADFGKLYGNAAGLTLKLSYSDRKLF